MKRILPALALLLPCASVFAWHDEGHTYIARAAVAALPDDVPTFFREGKDAIAHGSIDPDVIRNRDLPQLRVANAPEHFLDVEMLRGREIPETRYDYIRLCHELGIDPEKAGTLPYAIAEETQRLTMAFAEYRKYPNNPHVQRKCLVIAGELSHYTGDLHMPLHTTIHFNGIVQLDDAGQPVPDAPKQHPGIHGKVDALPTKLPYNVIFAEPLDAPEVHQQVLPYVKSELGKSHALVDRTYALADQLTEVGDLTLDDAEAKAFAIDRTRAAARFTASIYLSAWRNSADVAVPDWLDRRVFDEDFDPSQIPPQPKHDD